MKYFENYSDDGQYIASIQTSAGQSEISEERYRTILDILRNCPNEEGYGYRLRTDLTWEEYELSPVEEDPDPEISDSEALEIILGGEG